MCTFKKEERPKRRSRKRGEACRDKQSAGLRGGKQNGGSRMGETEGPKQKGGSRRAEAEGRKQKGGSRMSEAEGRKQNLGSRMSESEGRKLSGEKSERGREAGSRRPEKKSR